jgi:uncharacterized protein YlxW (UPF0749 family)
MSTRPHRGVGLAAVLALFGFLVATGLVQERMRQAGSPQRVAELARLVEARRATIDRLGSRVERLSAELGRLREDAGEGSRAVRGVVDRVEALRGRAGVETLRGPGIVVQLADSPQHPRTREEVTDFRIQDADLRVVVNALWRAGAEAIAVNGRRLASTTAIRKAGTVILVNYRAVSSPYRVAAIGEPRALRERLLASEIAERFEVWRDVYGLGFEVREEAVVEVGGLPGLPELTYAEPAGSAG